MLAEGVAQSAATHAWSPGLRIPLTQHRTRPASLLRQGRAANENPSPRILTLRAPANRRLGGSSMICMDSEGLCQ